MEIAGTEPHLLHITWRHPEATATLSADLRDHAFRVYVDEGAGEEVFMTVGVPGEIPATPSRSRGDGLAGGA
jgi:hypothetical protein